MFARNRRLGKIFVELLPNIFAGILLPELAHIREELLQNGISTPTAHDSHCLGYTYVLNVEKKKLLLKS